MTKHIDTLAEWWENAERGTYGPGDTVIQNHHTASDEYTVYVADEAVRDSGPYVRILHRAPAPTPAWHDAVAVTIGRVGAHDVYVRLPGRETWTNATAGNEMSTSTIALYEPVPLIEQKVTDEMVLAALQERSKVFGNKPAERIDNYATEVVEYTRAGLHAALGLDPA